MMKHPNILRYSFAALIALFFVACQSKQDKPANDNPDSTEITAKEVLQAEKYTYVLAAAGDKEYWLAIPTAEILQGATYYHGPGMWMQDFQSKDLDRTFDQVLFLEELSTEPIPMPAENPHSMQEAGEQTTGAHVKTEAAAVSVKPAEGGVTVAELFADPAAYAGKDILIRGQIVKVNNEIMDRNWIHIQDGTRYEDDFDLVITSEEFHQVGAVVTFQGKVAVDKDFGAGYFYKLIVEDGKAVR